MSHYNRDGIRVSNIPDAAKHLDTILPGWEKKIDFARLSMIDGTRCILGQLLGGYYTQKHFYVTSCEGGAYGGDSHGAFGSRASVDDWKKEVEKRLSPSTPIVNKATKYAQIAKLCGEVGNDVDKAKYTDLAIAELLSYVM